MNSGNSKGAASRLGGQEAPRQASRGGPAAARPGAVFVYDPALAAVSFGEDHPFRPDRARLFRELAERYGLLDAEAVETVTPEPASREALERFHVARYLDLVAEGARLAAAGPPSLEMLAVGLGKRENPIFPALWDFVTRAAGASLAGLEALLSGRAHVAFNPVGGFHHGFAGHAEGFCYLNDIALAAIRAREQGRRVAVVDIDAHHGNGTQAAFWEDSHVLAVSLHQDGRTIYPGTGAASEWGAGEGQGATLNVPLWPGSDDEVAVAAFDAVVPRALNAFRPDLVILQMGADMLAPDPLTGLRLTNRGHRYMVSRIAARGVPVLALGGGGYHPSAAVRAWTLSWAALTGQEPEDAYAHAVGGGLFVQGGGALLDPPEVAYDADKDAALVHLEETLTTLETPLGLLEARA